MYHLIKTLSLHGKPKGLSFAEIVKWVKTHFNPKPFAIINSYEFNTRKQKPGESVAEYVASLCKIAEHCDYGSTLNDMFRDRLVCGTADKRIQHCYCQETSLMYTQARNMALASDTSYKDSKPLQEPINEAMSSPQGENQKIKVLKVSHKPSKKASGGLRGMQDNDSLLWWEAPTFHLQIQELWVSLLS